MTSAVAAEEVDPLVRPRTELSADADVMRFAAVACAVQVSDTDPDSAAAQWSADREVTLAFTDDVSPEQLALVLPEFEAYARELADRPTDAVLTLPSRAIDLARVARATGFAPGGILAARRIAPAASGPSGSPSAPAVDAGITVRDATIADAATVARLWCQQADYEARVGTLRVSPEIHAAIEAEVPHHLERGATVLLAERAGKVLGAALASSVADSAWVAARLTAAPVRYLDMASTAPEHRGGGAGGALVDELHRRYAAEGVALSALHFSSYNPLSAPFWAQRGYRPVLTHYARTVRT